MKTSTSSASTRRLRAALLSALATGTLPVLAQEAPLVPANNGLEEIPDEELGQMRGRYTVGDNRVLWFGVSMITTWQTQAGQTVRGNLDVAIDLRGQRPTVTFTPNVNISEGASDAQTHIASGGSIDSAGLANVSGMVQSVQVAGDGNRAGNSTRLVVRSGDVPVSRQTYAAGASRAANGSASASATHDGQGIRLVVDAGDLGSAAQWIRPGSVGQSISVTGNGQFVSNELRMELVRQSLPATTALTQNVAQAIALNRGIGHGP